MVGFSWRGLLPWVILGVAAGVLVSVLVPGDLVFDSAFASTDTTTVTGDTAAVEGARAGSGLGSTDTTMVPGVDALAGASSSKCKWGERLDGTCRACQAKDHYHNGKKCVPKDRSGPTEPKCEADEYYFASYKGCRPKTCTHGRTSSGYCRSRPVCKAGHKYYSKYGGCRPASCENGRSSTGWCRACPSPTQYHDGTACVEKTVPAPGDPTCPADQLWYGYWSKCRPKTCDHGRNMSTGLCKAPPPKLPKPAGLTADGDNRSWYERYRSLRTGNQPPILPDDKYRAYISWPRVRHADNYSLRYAEWKLTTGKTGAPAVEYNWKPPVINIPNPASGTVTYTLDGGLSRNRLYAVSVRALAANRKSSEWSEPVYVYPTALVPAGPGDTVGIVPVRYYRPTESYDYVICTNRAPAAAVPRDLTWTSTIKNAVNQWNTTTGGTVSATAEVRECTDAEEGDEFRNMSQHDVIKIATGMDMTELGCARDDKGCALPWQIDEEVLVTTKIGIALDIDITKPTGGCSELYRVTIHEAGHAYGLSHARVLTTKSMMGIRWLFSCYLTEYDLAVIKSVYQSRTATDST